MDKLSGKGLKSKRSRLVRTECVCVYVWARLETVRKYHTSNLIELYSSHTNRRTYTFQIRVIRCARCLISYMESLCSKCTICLSFLVKKKHKWQNMYQMWPNRAIKTIFIFTKWMCPMWLIRPIFILFTASRHTQRSNRPHDTHTANRNAWMSARRLNLTSTLVRQIEKNKIKRLQIMYCAATNKERVKKEINLTKSLNCNSRFV